MWKCHLKSMENINTFWKRKGRTALQIASYENIYVSQISHHICVNEIMYYILYTLQ